MIRQRFSTLMVLVLMVTQILGPAVLWAAEQRGVLIEANERVLISAMSEGTLTAEAGGDSRTVTFGDVVNIGEELTTGKGTVAEVLIGNRAVVTLGEATAAQVSKLSPDQLTIQVSQGMVRVAASADALGEQGTVSIQTPTSEVKTRGGIVRVMVNTTGESVAQAPVGEAKPYLASYAPRTLVAANNADTDIIQVEEGVAEILGAGLDGEALAVTSGQQVTRQAGQAGLMTEGGQEYTMRVGVLADPDHSNTPKEGVDNLVALQVDQATQLGQVLTGASKTETKDAEKKDSNENPVNGATGGVQVASTIVNTLFGGGSASNPGTPNPTNSTGNGFGGNNNNGFETASAEDVNVKVNGSENSPGNPKALLIFTRKDPVAAFVKEKMTFDTGAFGDGVYEKDSICGFECLVGHATASSIPGQPNVFATNLKFGATDPSTDKLIPSLKPILSKFTVQKELVLVGGAGNTGHMGKAPTETLIIRGAAPRNDQAPPITNLASDGPFGVFPTDRFPADIGNFPGVEAPAGFSTPSKIVRENSTFVIQGNKPDEERSGARIDSIGGTLGQFSNDPTSLPDRSIAFTREGQNSPESFVDGSITATGSDVVLTGGVTLDRGTVATIGETTATMAYFGTSNPEFTGSLLSIIDEPGSALTSVTVQDRLLGVYDGSQILTPEGEGNKALLSVLDAKLKGPTNGAPLIDINAAFKDADEMNGESSGVRPEVTVTSAVVTRSTKPLDGGLLEASAPILALTKATMTTTSHFADLAGNQSPSIQLENMNNALVALNASSQLSIHGNLLNLNNATAAVNGYLFSLNGGSTLSIGTGASDVGTLFSLNNQSTLNLNGNAFGVFGSGTNTLAINNNLCAGACGTLVNSANNPILLKGAELKVAGVAGNVVLPNSFNVFAGNSATNFEISENAALIHVDDTSTLNINGTTVVQPKAP